MGWEVVWAPKHFFACGAPLSQRPKAAQPYGRTNLKQYKWLGAAGVRTSTSSRTPKTTLRDRTAGRGQRPPGTASKKT